MRVCLVASIALVLTVPAAGMAEGEDGLSCAEQASMVMQAVEARAAGDPIRKTRRSLRDALDKTAADMLAEWIYALPEDQLTDEVGALWETQCKAL